MIKDFCGQTASMWKLVGYALFALKILIPIIIIGLGAFEFSKAAVGNNDKDITQAASKLLKRFIFGVVIFFIPTIVHVVINLVSNVFGVDTSSIDACETCLLKPNDC